MIKAKFPAPSDVDELVKLINHSRIPNLSVEYGDGNHYNWELDPAREGNDVVNNALLVEVIGGDQLLYSSDSQSKAQSFLYGIFYALYEGKSLASINSLATKLNSMDNKSYASLVLEIEHFKAGTEADY